MYFIINRRKHGGGSQVDKYFFFFTTDDEIRQNFGFKNVSLGNVIPAAYKESVIPFLSDSDKVLLEKYRVAAFEVRIMNIINTY